MVRIGNNVLNEYVFVVASPQVSNGRIDLGAGYVQKAVPKVVLLIAICQNAEIEFPAGEWVFFFCSINSETHDYFGATRRYDSGTSSVVQFTRQNWFSNAKPYKLKPAAFVGFNHHQYSCLCSIARMRLIFGEFINQADMLGILSGEFTCNTYNLNKLIILNSSSAASHF